MAQTEEEKRLASMTRKLTAIEERIANYHSFMDNLMTQGKDHIARKVSEDIKKYAAAGYYANVTDQFLNVLENHHVEPTTELITKVLECASYTKWMAERQAGELAKVEEKAKWRVQEII